MKYCRRRRRQHLSLPTRTKRENYIFRRLPPAAEMLEAQTTASLAITDGPLDNPQKKGLANAQPTSEF